MPIDSKILNKVRFVDIYLFTTHIHPEHLNIHGNYVNRKGFTLSSVTVTFNFLKCICAGSDTQNKEEGRRQLSCLKQHTFHLD